MGEDEDGLEARGRSARCAEEGVDAIYGAWFGGAGVASKWNCCMFYFFDSILQLKEGLRENNQ